MNFVYSILHTMKSKNNDDETTKTTTNNHKF